MSIISTTSKSAKTNNRSEESSEYEGCWVNIGVVTQNAEGEEVFVRLSRGVAVSDLKTRPVYESMNPDFAARVSAENEIVKAIQGAFDKLGEGDSRLAGNLHVQLYRKNEEAVVETAGGGFDIFGDEEAEAQAS